MSLGKIVWSDAVSLLDEPEVGEALPLSEPALAEDWLKPGQDEAWAHLQPGR